ncbi:hypothetical protein D9M71_134620 [compost metagenome]
MNRIRNYWWLLNEDARYQPLPPVSLSDWMLWGSVVPGAILLVVYFGGTVLGFWR